MRSRLLKPGFFPDTLATAHVASQTAHHGISVPHREKYTRPNVPAIQWNRIEMDWAQSTRGLENTSQYSIIPIKETEPKYCVRWDDIFEDIASPHQSTRAKGQLLSHGGTPYPTPLRTTCRCLEIAISPDSIRGRQNGAANSFSRSKTTGTRTTGFWKRVSDETKRL